MQFYPVPMGVTHRFRLMNRQNTPLCDRICPHVVRSFEKIAFAGQTSEWRGRAACDAFAMNNTGHGIPEGHSREWESDGPMVQTFAGAMGDCGVSRWDGMPFRRAEGDTEGDGTWVGSPCRQRRERVGARRIKKASSKVISEETLAVTL
jgi:hypothetical protein